MRQPKPIPLRFALTLFCFVTVILASCGTGDARGGTQKASADKQVFVSPFEGIMDIETLDPALPTDSASINAIDMVFTGLVSLNDQMQVQPQLAQSYTASADGLTWTFTLKPNLKFSDGTPLTSQDVIYSIDRALSPQISSINGVSLTYLGLIQDADKRVNGKIPTLINDSLMAPDANTVVIKTSKKTGYFLETLSYPTAFVVEKKVVDQWGLKWTDHLSDHGGLGGDGPFKVQSYNHSTGIVFVPNLNYYGPKPQLQKVIMPFYMTVETGYEAYQAGQVESTAIPTADYAEAKTRTDEFHQVALLALRYYAMNYLVKPFDNIHIRQAFALAINKDLIVHTVLHDLDFPTNHIVPQGMPGYNAHLTGPDGIQKTSGDAARAKQLLAQGMREEGWTSVSQIPPIKFTYDTDSSTTENEVVAVMQMWQSVLGITVRLDPIDANKLGEEITRTRNSANGLQLWCYSWVADYPDAQDWLTLQFDKDSSENAVNYGQNPSPNAVQQQANQQLMEQADVNRDQNARLQQYSQAEQQVVNDVAWLPMYQIGAVYLLKPYVRDTASNALGLTPPDDWSHIYITKH
jgi:oligopeptide transport system substrate-binding protein